MTKLTKRQKQKILEEELILDISNISFNDLKKHPRGTVYIDRQEGEIRFIVNKGFASLTAYIGVRESHPIAGFTYESMPIYCHGGLTYSGKGEIPSLPKDYWFYGWDYAHHGDALLPISGGSLHDFNYQVGREWTPYLVNKDAERDITEFKALIKHGFQGIKEKKKDLRIKKSKPKKVKLEVTTHIRSIRFKD